MDGSLQCQEGLQLLGAGSGGQVAFPSVMLLMMGGGLKGQVESSKSTDGYRTGVTNRNSATSIMRVALKKKGRMGVDGVHLSEKGKSIFGHGL